MAEFVWFEDSEKRGKFGKLKSYLQELNLDYNKHNKEDGKDDKNK